MANHKRKYVRGLPPPPCFSLSEIADDAQLTQRDVASAERKTVVAVEKARLKGVDNLEWIYVDGGYPRCVAASLKKKLAHNPAVRRPRVPAKGERRSANTRSPYIEAAMK